MSCITLAGFGPLAVGDVLIVGQVKRGRCYAQCIDCGDVRLVHDDDGYIDDASKANSYRATISLHRNPRCKRCGTSWKMMKAVCALARQRQA